MQANISAVLGGFHLFLSTKTIKNPSFEPTFMSQCLARRLTVFKAGVVGPPQSYGHRMEEG